MKHPLPRLIRFASLSIDCLLATYDNTTNLLQIDKEYYDKLAPLDQHMVTRTQAPYLLIKLREGQLPKVVTGSFEDLETQDIQPHNPKR